MACIDLTDILDEDCGINAAGISELYWSYKADVLTITDGTLTADNTITAIAMKTGKKFSKIDFEDESGKIDYNMVGAGPGRMSLQALLDFNISKITSGKSRLLDRTMNAKVIIIAKDGNGLMHVMGHNRPCRRTPAVSSTGAAVADANQDAVQFTANVGERKFFTGSIPLTPAV